ncbi:DUF805 domain-containing protein [Pseudoduganella sp. R-31]|uniref:DUF805 domain-containing protein n=1 Tax=unclassified Pseudoduganella TaxID=2637179 RepID=UPI003CF4E5CB
MSNPYSMPQAPLVERLNSDETYMPKFFSLSGRIGRVRYLAYGFGAGLLMMPIVFLLAGLGALTGSSANGAGAAGAIGGLLGYALYLVAILSQVRRRLHDLGKSGWMGLLMIVPLVNIIFGLWLLFGSGDEGANEYGPAPAPNTTGVIILAWILPIIMIVGMMAAIAIPAYSDYSAKARAAQMQDSQ